MEQYLLIFHMCSDREAHRIKPKSCVRAISTCYSDLARDIQGKIEEVNFQGSDRIYEDIYILANVIKLKFKV